jgi:uncharacterized FAD-dependent dehydrogenase
MRTDPGKLEKTPDPEIHVPPPVDAAKARDANKDSDTVVVVGCGPAGLFAALRLAEAGRKVVILERGQPVEERGRDIGAMIHRRILQRDSNICYGEGGAGTWSDGKLTTRIGRNSGPVRWILEQLVRFGAPEDILVNGKPHLGTDRLVVILKKMRAHLEDYGVEFRFGCRVEDVVVKNARVTAVTYRKVARRGDEEEVSSATAEEITADRVIMSAGHSARELYDALARKEQGMLALSQKGFAVGFR